VRGEHTHTRENTLVGLTGAVPMLATAMASLTELKARVDAVMLRDQRRLRRRIDSLAGHAGRRDPAVAARLDTDVAEAEQRLTRRLANVPVPTYPAKLPISQRREEIAAAIREHQVVIVAGETGSGKTTQLPKICLELGRGVRGLIGHTQPRRIAARSVAERIADELATPLGSAVGYQIRFTGQVGEQTLVKVMTDGILLAELGQDRLLHQYDTLIIDEAHERSLNIDFILGYLKQLLPRRPDLKVIITSATIDPHRFARHFASPAGDAPVIEVSGRTYPVEIRYRPLIEEPAGEDTDDEALAAEVRDQIQAICEAVDELCAEGPGDILVFLSGEREIRDTADALRRQDRPVTEILPLYARLSTAEQHRVFSPHRGRRIVLATNVAETSLTVPGIRYVIDPGNARISRYSHRLKVQRLPIEPVSRASASQRAGRCGRTSDGICIRLYPEADFAVRPEFTDPEILRTNLASVILQMTALGLGDVAAFPFLDPPDRRNIADGIDLLHELGALEPGGRSAARRLSPLGRRLAQLPIDPRLGRMVLEAERNGCLREVLVIAAALSIQDPRERPTDARAAADEKHARFADPGSDFLTYLNLWRHLQERQRELSSSQFRRMCRAEFLNYLRVREWQDLESQLRQAVRGLDRPKGVPAGSSAADPDAHADAVHRSLLAGLLSHIGVKDPEKPEYLGARNARFAVFPGSALFRRTPRWVMAAELVQTTRLWAREVARIEPEWAEALAGHLVRRSYSEPHWDAGQGAVLAYERVTLYGLPLVVGRTVQYSRVDPGLCRELFIRHALVEGDWETHHRFFHANRELLHEVEELEHRARRRDMVVDDETLVDFYDRRIPAEVVSARHFDTWWKRTARSQPDLLDFSAAMLVNPAAGGFSPADFPDVWQQCRPGRPELNLPLSYRFEPGEPEDGVTVHIALPLLGEVADDFDWQVPGLREELVTALIRTLPKPVRRNFVPVPDHVKAVLEQLSPNGRALRPALSAELQRLTGVSVDPTEWRLDQVPDHLRMTLRVEDEHGAVLAEGKDLAALRERLRPLARKAVAALAAGVERHGLTSWTIGTLPRVLHRQHGGHTLTVYPALVDEGGRVGVRAFSTEAEQQQAMAAGTRRMLLLTVPSPVPQLSRRLSTVVKLGLTRYPYLNVPDLLEDCVGAAADRLLADAGGPAWDEEGYARLRDAVRAGLAEATAEIVVLVERAVAAADEARAALGIDAGPDLAPSMDDMRAQLVALVGPGFVTATGWEHLPDLPRYLRAITRRAQKLPTNPERDRDWMGQVHEVRAEYEQLLAALTPVQRSDPEVAEVRWMIEELRVSYFAQDLRTPYPVSPQRIRRFLATLSCRS
jgi:ATP-dependent helicase HrpA